MEIAGFGTTMVFVLAAMLWLAYLIPVWARKREYLSTERNAVRLQQTLRVMAESAETPEVLRIESTARMVAKQQRVLEKEQQLQQAIDRSKAVERARELDQQIKQVEKQVKAAVAGSVSRRVRLRRTRLACTAMLAASVVVGVIAGFASGWVLLAVAVGVGVLSLVGLVQVNASATAIAAVAAAETASVERIAQPIDEAMPAETVEERAWTPVRVPAQIQRPVYREDPLDGLRAAVRRAEIERLEDEGRLAHVTQLAERESERRVERVAAQQTEPDFEQLITGEHESMDAAEHAPRAPSRFATMGVVADADASDFDVSAVFRRRVG